ncbi:HEAT repeat domain-containing protein [Streptomyces sp. NPDC051020]|uniref:HEAT repeat domain-containing protein n=1 Tax=Streptomyces sp. NPDC051020 TaxID=3155409 RepID=UPI0034262402
MALSADEAINQLGDRTSAKRRSAAKRLNKLAYGAAGPELLRALRREVGHPRTWETQYEMVMALAACKYRPAIEFLTELAQRPTEDTALRLALGNSIVQLRSAEEGFAAPLRWCMDQGDPSLLDGALRAVAENHAPLDTETVDRVLGFLDPLDPYDGLRYWAAVAAAQWPDDRVRTFLKSCVAGPRADVAAAAATSLASRPAKGGKRG